MAEQVELPEETFKEILNELFASGTTVKAAHTKFEEDNGEGKLTLETCNQYYLEFIKERNSLKQAERLRAIDAQEPPPRLLPEILERAEDYRARSQEALDNWNASRGVKIEAMIEELVELNLEEHTDAVLKQELSPESYKELLGASEDIVARTRAREIVSTFQRKVWNPEEEFDVLVAIHGNRITVASNEHTLCVMTILPHGCASSALDILDCRHYRTSAISISIELLIALFALENVTFTNLTLQFGIPRDNTETESPETTEICCSFFKAFDSAKNMIDTSKIEMEMEFIQPDLYEKAQSLMQFTPVSVAYSTQSYKWSPKRIYLPDEVRLKEIKQYKEINRTSVTFKF